MATVERVRTFTAPCERVWAVLADFGQIAEWAGNVDHSVVLTAVGEGEGAARRVQVGRLALIETIVDWDPPRRLAYSIAGLPPRLGEVVNEWTLEAMGEQTRVILATSVDPGPRPPQQGVGRLVAGRMAKASDKMLDGLASHLTTGSST